MHRRARHINPKHAGAALVLDSRYVAGNDGDAIATWSDRSGNGYDATEATNKPLLKTRRAGGANGLHFSTTSARMTIANGFTNLFQNDNDFMFMVAMYSSDYSNNPLVFCWGTADVNFFLELGTQSTPTHYLGLGGATFRTYNAPVMSANQVHIATVQKYTTTTADLRINGRVTTSIASGTIAATPNSANSMVIGNYPTGTYGIRGDMYRVIACRASLGTPLLKRLEHSAAFSFKIACN